ncbi:hypothetical protein [Halorubrum pallidum]
MSYRPYPDAVLRSTRHVNIDADKTIQLITLAEFITEQNIESVLLEYLAESLDAAHVESSKT